MEKEFTCIVCPKGCHIIVDGENISGYTCKRGLDYVLEEMENPKRNISSSVKVSNLSRVLTVKTSNPIPKDKIFEVMKKINEVEVKAPIKFHQVIIKNVCDLGVDIISTMEL